MKNLEKYRRLKERKVGVEKIKFLVDNLSYFNDDGNFLVELDNEKFIIKAPSKIVIENKITRISRRYNYELPLRISLVST